LPGSYNGIKMIENIYMKYAIIFSVGAVAQLGEHCVRIAGVRGSNPLSSTKPLQYLSSVFYVLKLSSNEY
jgi:hypothetical protein